MFWAREGGGGGGVGITLLYGLSKVWAATKGMYLKCIYGVSPQYLLDLIKIKESSQYQLRSYWAYNAYRTKKTLGDSAFENVAPKVWNRLPLDFRQ